MPYRVFLSHAWPDRWLAQQLERRITTEARATTFIDVFDIAKGDDFEEQIFNEIGRTDELVVLLTPWAVDRNWVWVEIGAARAVGCRIVPVLYQVSLDAIEDSGGTTFLRAKNVVDISDLDTYLKELKRRVSKRKK